MNESAGGGEDVAVPILLKTLEDILYNIITQKKVEMQKNPEQSLRKYQKRSIDRAWVTAELIDLAKEMRI
jgi:hypothetical protein